MMPYRAGLAWGLFFLLHIAVSSPGETRTWSGGTGDWFDDAKWGGTRPAAGDDVVIDASGSHVLLPADTPALASFTLGPGTLTFTNWTTTLSAEAVTIASGGVVTHVGCDTNPVLSNTNRIHLVCATLTVDAGGAINADFRGYTNEIVSVIGTGQGPGGGYGAAGGSHGGAGSRSPKVYGSAAEPLDPGSAGGTLTYSGSRGGCGGGAVLIEATGAVTVNGSISANGENSINLISGGGAGGGILIRCLTFGGQGLVSADAGRATGNNDSSVGGGGGRIAVQYDAAAQAGAPASAVRFSALAGWNATFAPMRNFGDIGTLHFPDAQLLGSTAPHNGQVLGFSSWSPGDVVFSNGWLRFAEEDFALTVTNGLLVTGASGVTTGRLEIGSALYDGYLYTSAATDSPALRVGGGITLAGASSLHVFSGMTNGDEGAFGALVACTNDLAIASGCWIQPYSHRTNGGSAYFLCSNLTISAGGGFNADGKGFFSSLTVAYGPGVGVPDRSGSGHGGRGGDKTPVSGVFAGGGLPYGRADRPLHAGSASKPAGGVQGLNGGGVVRVRVENRAAIDGTISADGGGRTSYSGGGAGGSVDIACRVAAGSGVIRAAGGRNPTSSNGGAGGGGGRIALRYDTAAQAPEPVPSIRFSVAGARASERIHDIFPYYSDIGTVYLPDATFLTNVLTHDGEFVIPGFTNWAPASLAVSNGWIRFVSSGGTGFTLRVAGDLTVFTTNTGVDALLDGRLELGPGSRCLVGGNLLLTNGADLFLYSGPTNPLADHGAYLEAAGRFDLFSNSWLYAYSHPSNGGSPLVRAGSVFVAAGGGIDASGRGFDGANGLTGYGYGPGRGYTKSGAGHGGMGGRGSAGTPGGTYGDSNAPAIAGSSGGNSGTSWPGGPGGGLIRLQSAGPVVLQGRLSADGYRGSTHGGGGSGGGILLEVQSLTGPADARITAGGSRGDATAGAGGGGRIALRYGSQSFAGLVAATGGLGSATAGTNGTVVWKSLAPAIVNLGATNILAVSADLVGQLVYTGETPAEVGCFWGTSDGGENAGAWQTSRWFGAVEEGVVITNTVDGLQSAQGYFFRFFVTNGIWYHWAAPSVAFSTPGGGPTVNNEPGASAVGETAATLAGVAVGNPDPAVYVCWGEAPGSASTDSWQHVVSAGTRVGPFQVPLSGLLANKTYYYRCYVTNETGEGWAASETNFTTAPPTCWIEDAPAVAEGDAGVVFLDFPVSLSSTSGAGVAVSFAASDGWAEAGSDYAATNGTLLFAASNSVREIVRVVVTGDTDDEHPFEDLYVTLSSPSGATLTAAQARGRVDDDDDGAETRTWTGFGSWTNFANWSPRGTPGPLDQAVIASGTCLLDNAQTVAGLEVSSGAVLTFTNWSAALSATTVTVKAGGVMTHEPWPTNLAVMNTSRVHVVCGSLLVEGGGRIDATGKGYPGDAFSAYGPGAAASGMRTGGSHGGLGGDITEWCVRRTYGRLEEPETAGSSAVPITTAGGSGGGVIRIEAAGAVVVDGVVAVEGTRQSQYAGGGAGGSVWVTCGTIGGTGKVSAAGGRGGSETYNGGGGGGGGRIAVHYDTAAQGAVPVPELVFSAAGGHASLPAHDYWPYASDAGTLYFPDARLLGPTVRHSGEWHVPGLTAWSPSSLAVEGGWLRFGATGFVITVAGDLTVAGAGGTADSIFEGRLELQPGAELQVGGGMTFLNGGDLHVVSGATNEGVEYGARVTAAGAAVLQSNSWIYVGCDTNNGGSPFFRFGSLSIAEGAGVEADRRGFYGLSGADRGVGPGGATLRSGAGHGGAGGAGSEGAAGGTYGDSNAPVDAGSCGGWLNWYYQGGRGGGVVRIRVDGLLSLAGRIQARGGQGTGYSGGGSGGSVYLQAQTFQAATGALITVRGGAGAGMLASGGGGGGRIAVWRARDRSPLPGPVFEAAGGAGNAGGAAGSAGTVVLGFMGAPGTVILLR